MALKKTKKNKIRKCILTLCHFLAEVIYIPGFKIYIFTKVSTKFSLFEGFKQNEIFFNETLIINVFLSKSIKKTLCKPYKAIMYW